MELRPRLHALLLLADILHREYPLAGHVHLTEVTYDATVLPLVELSLEVWVEAEEKPDDNR